MKNTFLLFVMILSFAACKKDEVVETNNNQQQPVTKTYTIIKPQSYYPVYPGSWWKYMKNDSIPIEHKTSPQYLKHCYLLSYNGYGQPARYSDTVLVPFLNGNPVYGYDKIVCSKEPFYPVSCSRWPILSETVGAFFGRGWEDPRYEHSTFRYTVVSKTTDQDSKSVLTVEGRSERGSLAAEVEVVQYVKDIGMVFSCRIDTVKNDTLYKIRLIDHFINKKD